uniref:Uncharacterized protein n=1 Tax=Salix viminalis TaxID=40686 RepID=A0A6N2N9H3_SALVM
MQDLECTGIISYPNTVTIMKCSKLSVTRLVGLLKKMALLIERDANLWNAWILWEVLHQLVHVHHTSRVHVYPITQALPHLRFQVQFHPIMLPTLMVMLMPIPSSHGLKTSPLAHHQPLPRILTISSFTLVP